MKKSIFAFLILLVTACLPPSGGVAPQQTTADTPPAIEKSPAPEPTPTVNPNEALAAWVTEQIADDISQQPYLQALEAVTGDAISQACVDFVIRLGAFEENLSENQAHYVFHLSADGDYCYVTTADGTVIVDAWNNDGPLYLTPANASQALGVAVTRVSADGRHGSIGDAYDAEGRRVGGVSRFLLQWEAVNANGVLPSEADPSSVPPTPVNPGESNLYQVNYAPAIDEEAQAQAMTNLAIGYENGDVTAEEIDKMSFEKRKEFSIALNEYRNELNGPHSVIYTDESGNKLYLGPDGKFHSEPQTVEARRPKVFDDEGNMEVFYNGEWVEIAGSNSIKYDTDIKNGNFNWPTGDKVDPKWVSEQHKNLLNLTNPEYSYSVYGEDVIMAPVFFLEKTVGKINIPGRGSVGSIIGLIINEKDKYSATTTIINGGAFHLYMDDVRATSIPEITERSDLFNALEKNTLYYLMLKRDQKKSFAQTFPRSNGVEVTTGYSGLAPSDLVGEIVTGESKSNNIIWINGMMLVKASNNQ